MLFLSPGRPVQGAHLVRWFSALSFLAAAAVSAVLALVLTRFGEAQLLDHDAELSRQFVQSIVDKEEVARYFEPGDAPGRSTALANFFGHVAAMPDVLRANVYALDGQVLWSSDAALTGQRFTDNDELARALRGELVIERGAVNHEGPTKGEHRFWGGTDTHFVENYLPVRQAGAESARQIGVVELYRVPRALNATLRMGSLLVWIGTLLGGLVLYSSTLWLVLRASHTLQEQQARLVDAQAMAVVGEMAASVAHSIRNPLASIRSTAELQQALGDGPVDSAQDTINHVDRIERLVRTLLHYTHAPAEDLVERQVSADLAGVLEEVRAGFEAAFRAQGTVLSLQLEAGLPPVQGSAVMLAQVANSLLANALEATAAGDSVVVRAAMAPGAARSVQFEVCDSGPGISPAGLAQAFKPFHTTKAQGLGLGLSLARRTLERLGGSVALESQPGRTRAIVRVPIHVPAPGSGG